MDRREFLKKAGAGAAAGMLASSFVFADEVTPAKGKAVSSLPAIEADVIVVGAGASGIPAAIAAARQGARVILLEQDAMPGGAPVNMYITMLCGGPRLGIFREMCQMLNNEFTLTGSPKSDFGPAGENGKNHWYLPSSFVLATTRMIKAEKNLQLVCGARVSDVIMDKRTIKGVRIDRYGVYQDVRGKVVIDATGVGLIGALAGAPVMYGRDGRAAFNENIGAMEPDQKVQRCTWMFISQRMRPDAVLPKTQLKNGGMVEDDLNHWVLPEDVNRKAGIYLHWGATVICEDTRDPTAIAAAQMTGLKTLATDARILLDAGFLMHLAPKLGVRESRRIRGEYVLTTTDMQQGIFPDDTIAHTSYGIDAWGEKMTKEQQRTKPHGIPYRCLLPLDVEGLIMAGKAISGSHLAASGFRVQPIVASIGQAAGTAAAMSVADKCTPRRVDVAKLRESLRRQGLFMKKDEAEQF